MSPQDFIKSYESALASQNWNHIAPLLHTDICVTFSDGTYKGIEAVKSVFIRNFSAIKDEDYRISRIHWAHIADQSAVCLYEFQWEGLIHGEKCSGGGRGTSVLVREKDQWLLVSEHLGPYPSQ
ncbi:MAG: DUF4440 domain-containing protein [Endozoicomonas sp.]|uniref:DUF4440 domain-containing protein n=1 Tax=Endozoicomonas sp. TaxID=1892382 RepID=UPI003D9AE510